MREMSRAMVGSVREGRCGLQACSRAGWRGCFGEGQGGLVGRGARRRRVGPT